MIDLRRREQLLYNSRMSGRSMMNNEKRIIRMNISEELMIARTGHGTATNEKADEYVRHFTTRVVPHLREIEGHRGAYLLRREIEGQVEFLAMTLWDTIETVKSFAGPNPNVAMVEPEARAALSKFDFFAENYEVAYS
jgi:heme-degrading monooxygenase HmoA